jgi:hypothetical protein
MTRIENQKHFVVCELCDRELDQASGGTSGLIYAVVVGAQRGMTPSKFGEGLAADLMAGKLSTPTCN